jgi:hypothetical protein
MPFSFQELKFLKSAEGKKLKQVIYNNWQNKTSADDSFEFLEKLELKFDDGYRIVLAASESDEPGIIVVEDFDFEKTRLMLLHEFNGKIDYRDEEMTTNILWSIAVGQTLQLVGLIKTGEETYSNEAVMFDFGDEKLEVRLGVEGLIVEPFEIV